MPPELAIALLWAAGLFIPLFLYWRDITHIDHGSILGHAYWGRDFVILWTGGQFVHDGAVSAIYDFHAFQAKLASLFGPLDPMGYPYPPVTFPIAFTFGLLPYWLAQPLWFALTGALFIYACRPFWTSPMGPRWLAVLTPAALMNIWAGHYGFLHGALFLLGWSHVEKRPRVAGIFFGLMLIKPHIAVLVPIALALRRQWTAILSAAVTVVALIGLTSLVYGWETWRDYLANMIAPQVGLIGAKNGFFTFMSTSTMQAVLRMTDNQALALAAHLTVVFVSLAALVAAARRNPPLADLALFTATLTFLVLPYGFNYDLTVVMVGALALISRRDLPLGRRLLAAVGFLAPTVGMLVSGERIAIMPLMLAALAYTQFRSIGAAKPSENMAAVPAAAMT
jgi:hypothetical protein